MAEPEFTFTDADGQFMRLYMREDGGAVLRWPSGYKMRFTKEQFDQFMAALEEATREGKSLVITNIDTRKWMH